MIEQSGRFGRAHHLIGICSLPKQGRADGAVGVILLNAGIVHRVGPFRLHVDLCRRLAMAGYPALRFDLSGIGDSRSGAEGTQADQVAADTADAMRHLAQASGCARFVLIGLCSGADNAHAIAHNHDSVAGAVFLDGYAYRTPGYALRYYAPRVFSLARWWRFIVRRVRAMRQRPPRAAEAVFAREFPPQSQIRKDLGDMVARGLKLNFIFTDGAAKYFNHRRQFRECYGRIADSANVHVDLFAQADHTYVLGCDRARLIEGIEGWMRTHFPLAPTGGRA